MFLDSPIFPGEVRRVPGFAADACRCSKTTPQPRLPMNCRSLPAASRSWFLLFASLATVTMALGAEGLGGGGLFGHVSNAATRASLRSTPKALAARCPPQHKSLGFMS